MVGIGVVLHELITDGAKVYNRDSIENPATVEIFVGAALTSKSSDIISKTVMSFKEMPGTWMKDTDQEIPNPLFKEMAGTLEPNNMKNPWRHEYQVKVNGRWKTKGSGSSLKHGIYTVDNPEAAAGTRPGVMVVEEVGLLSNVLMVHSSNEYCQIEGTVKFGSTVYLGCVCKGTKVWTNDGKLINVEDLKINDGVIGYHSNGALQQSIEKIKDPEKKRCYRINFTGGDSLECSYDHPILISKRHFDKNIDKKKYRVCTFREAQNIKEGDQIATISSVPIFGKKHIKDARLFGMLVGDGYYGSMKAGAEISLDSDGTIDFIETVYNTTTRKEFTTKKGTPYKSVYIKGIRNLLLNNGMLGQSKLNKKLPKDIDEYDMDSLAEFIGGYFDSDGTVGFNKNGNVRVSLSSISKELIYDIKYRLLKFGIDSSVNKEKIKNGYGDGKRIKYVLYVSKHESVLKFAQSIQFKTKWKEDRLLSVFDEILKRNGHTKLPLVYAGGDDGNFFEDSTIVSDITFKTIVNVEEIGEQPVYNMTAGGTHTYIANNVITHNTGGNMEKIVESEIIFRDPDSYGFLSFEDEWEGKGNLGWFVPAYYALNQFKDNNGNTDIEKSMHYLDRIREKKRKAKSATALLLEMMSRPVKPSEMFIRRSGSLFPIEDLKDTLSDLESSNITLDSSWKARFSVTQDGSVSFMNSTANPIRKFPLKRGDDMNGCVEIFEMPKKLKDGTIPSGRYIAGTDPVDDDGNDNHELSLQSTIILDTWTDRIVAEYTERTRFAHEYYETLRRLLIFYNAKTNYEQNKKGLYGYFKSHKALHLLAETPDIISDRDLVRTSGIGNKKYGTPNAGTRLNGWGLELILSWLMKPAYGTDESEMVPNYKHIRSVGLLLELIAYDSDLNADRVSAMIMLMLYREDIYETIESNKKQERGIENSKFWNNHYVTKKTQLKRRREKRARTRKLNW